MRRRRLPLTLLLPVGLVALVATLAALQYRWLGQVSEAEREELSRSLEQRANEFIDDFDRELSRAYLAFQIGGELAPKEGASIASRLASWRAVARFPDIVQTVYLADGRDDGHDLLRYDTTTARLEPVDWPARFESVRRRLTPRVTRTRMVDGREERQVVSVSASPLVGDIPALVVPVATAAAGVDAPGSTVRILERGTGGVMLSLRSARDYLIVELDRALLVSDVLPALAERHFGEGGGERYRVSVVDSDGAPLLSHGVPSGATVVEVDADVAKRFFHVRLDLARPATAERSIFAWASEAAETVGTVRSGRGDALPAPAELSIMVGRAASAARTELAALTEWAGWQLLVQHSAGSLDAAVARARTRNLWLSFGILSVLGAAVGLVVLNARRSERLAVQQMDFVATVSHELRTPLAVIRSAAQNLSAGVVHEAGQAKKYGDLIEAEGRRLTDMVEQVLEYAGLSGTRHLVRAVPIDLGAIVGEAVAAATAPCREQGVDLKVETAPDLPLIVADQDAVRRALDNLVSNALKYGADGRWIKVTAKRVSVRGGDEVQLAVSDRGRGIDPEELGHIFEAFYRGRYAVDRQIRGNGLGLSLVRRIAETHGGRVTVRSIKGEGTTFTLHLPGVEADRSAQRIGEPATDAGPPA